MASAPPPWGVSAAMTTTISSIMVDAPAVGVVVGAVCARPWVAACACCLVASEDRKDAIPPPDFLLTFGAS